MKRCYLFALAFIFLSLISLSGVYAQETDSSEVVFDEGAELQVSEGITPDSALYFIDNFFDRFGDDLNVREEKIAEIRAMISEGKVEEARKALRNYEAYADRLEKEVNPENREATKESASAIHNAIREIEDQIPEEDRGVFVDDVLDRERGIVTASEIASKIKDLCEALSSIDPLEYSRVCITGDDSPRWHKTLDKDLTSQQREEAKKFGRIMQQCFETAGQQCNCEEIPFADFAEACSIAAPLAAACEIENNEAACEEMDNLEMPELPPHLQDVLNELEGDISDSQRGLHMPRECQSAGITNPRECGRLMIQTNAPEECKAALLEANVQNEREARSICEKIMFEQNAPIECVEAGLTNPKECGLFMFQETAPQECIDAGLTGERQSDHKKCREMMDSLGRDQRGPNSGPESGFNCRGIENSEDRLACYDGALQGAHEQRVDFEARFRGDQEAMRMCADRCLSQGAAWDFRDGNCNCRENQDNFARPEPFEGDFDRQEGFDGGERVDGGFTNEGESFENFEDKSDGTFSEGGGEFDSSGSTTGGESESDAERESSTEASSNTGETTTDSSTTESTGSTGSADSGSSDSGDGSDLISGNSFFNYYFE
ncbi:MAG: hypothetical protein Q8P81_02170 [Nanoarchaeota archaeon]|nr:hypothetical protein [Nanoarchaeota archaeon]